MVLSLEQYIAQRKKEDKLNEFNKEARMSNLRKCVDYVFEYFNQYLDIEKIDEQTELNNERLTKYKKTIAQYDPDIQEWLVNIYDEHNKQLNRSIVHYLKKDELFYLYYSDSEFRSLSYECYAHLIQKNPFLRDQTEMLYLFIKDYHQIQSQQDNDKYNILISDEVNQWVEKTWHKYKVNIFAFCSDWVHRFYDNEDLWPASHKKKSDSKWIKFDYDYKQKSNLFNLNSLYRRISGKPFLKGKRQYLEMIMLYCWLDDIESDDDYWQEYLSEIIN